MVRRLVLIDALGPLAAPPEEARNTMARYLAGWLATPKPPVYASKADAAEMRARLSDFGPDVAQKLVSRDLRQIHLGFQWRHDAKLRLPFLKEIDEAKVLAYMRSIEAPILLLQAKNSAISETYYHSRSTAIRNLRKANLPGGHHAHLERPSLTALAIHEFLVDEAD